VAWTRWTAPSAIISIATMCSLRYDDSLYYDSTTAPGDLHNYQVTAVNHAMKVLCHNGSGMRRHCHRVTGLTASETLCSEVCLEWNNAENRRDIIFPRCSPFDTVGPDVINYCDTTVAPDVEYDYTVEHTIFAAWRYFAGSDRRRSASAPA